MTAAHSQRTIVLGMSWAQLFHSLLLSRWWRMANLFAWCSLCLRVKLRLMIVSRRGQGSKPWSEALAEGQLHLLPSSAASPPHHKGPPYSGHALADVLCVFSKLERRGNHHVSYIIHGSWMRLPFMLLLIWNCRESSDLNAFAMIVKAWVPCACFEDELDSRLGQAWLSIQRETPWEGRG